MQSFLHNSHIIKQLNLLLSSSLMAFHPNHLQQEMALQQHFTDTDNISVLRTILPNHHHLAIAGQSSPSSRSAGKDHWLNSAILRQQGQYDGGATEGGNNNFLNLQTNNNSDSAVTSSSHHHHHAGSNNNTNNNNQWLSRSMLQRNVGDVRGDDIVSQVSNDSIIAAMSSHGSPDLNNQSRNIVAGGQVDNNGGELGESEVGGNEAAAAVNWQTARYKAEVLSHPLYEQLLSAHVSCLRIATPVDQLPRIDAQLVQSQHVVSKYSGLAGQNNIGDDKELDQFMTHYVMLLCSFKEQLQQHVRVHAMEAVMACWEIEQSLQSLTVVGTGVSPGEGTGATMSDDEEDQVDSDANLFDGSFDGHDSTGFGPLVPTESERPLMERIRQELKHELKQGYKEKIVDIREEILRKRRAGKLPGDTTSVLKSWWQSHAKWPYPTEEDKARLVQETGLQLKQINNWFINQRKRNWHSSPSSSTVLKTKRKR